MFPIENVFICLKEIFSEAWCDIILPTKGQCRLICRKVGFAGDSRRAKRNRPAAKRD